MASSARTRRERTEDEYDEQLSPADEQRRQMALRHVRQYPDPVLRAETTEVEAFDEELVALSERMRSIMHDAAGVGLAAPQLGLRLRLFTYQPEDGPAETVVNPRITTRGDETDVEIEGCLSLGDAVRVPVERAVAITVDGFDEHGSARTWELDGFYARVFQHEIDHLDGILMIDRTEDVEARRAAMHELRPRP